MQLSRRDVTACLRVVVRRAVWVKVGEPSPASKLLLSESGSHSRRIVEDAVSFFLIELGNAIRILEPYASRLVTPFDCSAIDDPAF
jgi:hypothetical protein